jgi:hypothetical protein
MVYSSDKISVSWIAPEHRRFEEVYQFVVDKYWQSLRVRIRQPYSRYLAAFDGEKLITTLGVSFASEQKLFSEQYFEPPIELIASEITGQALSRVHIAEIGQLVGSSVPDFCFMVSQVRTSLFELDYPFALVTVTKFVRGIFRRGGYPFLPICRAEAIRVSRPDDWGDYYSHMPVTGLLDLRPQVNFPLRIQHASE